MKIGVLYRKNRNIEFQKKVSKAEIYDDAYDEARMHASGLQDAGYEVELIEWNNNPIIMNQKITSKSIELVFNASSYQELVFLETFKIPYVGSSSRIVGTDKVQRKILCS